MHEHGTKTTPAVFIWSPCYAWQFNATRKNLFLYLEGDRLGLRKPEEKDYCYYIIFLARFRCSSSSKFLLPNRTCIDMKQGQQFISVRYFNVVRAFPQCHSI